MDERRLPHVICAEPDGHGPTCCHIYGQDPKRRQAWGTACRATDQVRDGDQFKDRQADRSHDSAERAGAGGQSDQMKQFWILDFRFWIERFMRETVTRLALSAMLLALSFPAQ